MKNFIRILIVLASVVFVSNSFAIGLEVAVGGWAQSLDGHLAYESVLPADSLDLDRDTGYADEERLFGRIKIDLPILPNIYLMGTPMEFEGDGNKTFNFGSVSITGDFYSKVKMDHYDLALYYGVPFTGLATLDTIGIDFGVNLRQLDVEMVVTDKSNPAVTDSLDETLYIPMVFLAIQIKPTEKLAFEAELRGIAYDNNHYYDLIGRIKYRFAGVMFAAAGWRHEDLEIDEKDILAKVRVSGPFAEAGFQF